MLKAARAADKALIEPVSVFDVFAGAEGRGADGRRARSRWRSPSACSRPSATLTEAEIEAVSAKVVASVAKATGGTLRT